MHKTVLLAFAALCVLPVCKPSSDTAEPPAPVPATQEGDMSQEASPMAEHFLEASKIKDNIVYGELASTKKPAQWLIDNVVADQLPVKWRPHVPKVHAGAKTVVNAEDMATASKGASEIALACGACHQDVGIDVAPSFKPLPLEDDTSFGEMDRHGFAVDRMWEALIGPSDKAWEEGTGMLADAPMEADEAPAEVKDLAARVHGLAAGAKAVTDPGERAAQFAEILTTCTDCHAKTRD